MWFKYNRLFSSSWRRRRVVNANPDGAGGGAGGYRESQVPQLLDVIQHSPIANLPVALPVTATGYPVTVGGAGGASWSRWQAGGVTVSDSVFIFQQLLLLVVEVVDNSWPGQDPGGSGGGAGGGGGRPSSPGGAGNTPPTLIPLKVLNGG